MLNLVMGKKVVDAGSHQGRSIAIRKKECSLGLMEFLTVFGWKKIDHEKWERELIMVEVEKLKDLFMNDGGKWLYINYML